MTTPAVTEGISAFRLVDAPVTGSFVHIHQLLDALAHQFDYPLAVQRHLAELTTIGCLLAGMLHLRHKNKGTMSLQIKQGHQKHPQHHEVTFMVVEITAGAGATHASSHQDADVADQEDSAESEALWHVRSCASMASQLDPQSPLYAMDTSIVDLFPQGLIVFSIDQGDGSPLYQGIVNLEGATVTEAFNHYFRQSVQTDLMVATQTDLIKNNWRSLGVALHHLPPAVGQHPVNQNESSDLWVSLLQGLSQVQLDPSLPLGGIPETLCRGHKIRERPLEKVAAVCKCSRGKVIQLLRTFSKQDLASMYEDDVISVTCDFCAVTYTFKDHDFKLELV